MPSVAVSPLQIVLTGGATQFTPARFTASPLRLSLAIGDIVSGPGTGDISEVTSPSLNRLMRQESIVGGDGQPSQRFQQIWQSTMEAIEAAFSALTMQVASNTAILAQIQAAQRLAQAANDNAVSVKTQVDITQSYTDPTSVLTADSTGTITIAAHDRVYGDGTRVAVDAGSASGYVPGDYVSVYYDDAGRTGGAVAYQVTVNAVAQGGVRHVVGSISVPQAGEPPSEGGGVPAPGYTPSPDGGNREYELP